MAKSQHCHSNDEFHIQSTQRNFKNRLSIQQECDELKKQLSEKDDHIKNLMRENEELKNALNDLQAKSVTANVDKKPLQTLSEEQVKEILKQYFTEDQIWCSAKDEFTGQSIIMLQPFHEAVKLAQKHICT